MFSFSKSKKAPAPQKKNNDSESDGVSPLQNIAVKTEGFFRHGLHNVKDFFVHGPSSGNSATASTSSPTNVVNNNQIQLQRFIAANSNNSNTNTNKTVAQKNTNTNNNNVSANNNNNNVKKTSSSSYRRRQHSDDDDDEAYESCDEDSDDNDGSDSANDSDEDTNDDDDDDDAYLSDSSGDSNKKKNKKKSNEAETTKPPSYLKSTKLSESRKREKVVNPMAQGSAEFDPNAPSTTNPLPPPTPSKHYPAPAVMVKLPSEKLNPSALRRVVRRLKEWHWRRVTLTDQEPTLDKIPSLVYSDLTTGIWRGSFPLSSITSCEKVSPDLMKQNGCPNGMDMKGWSVVSDGKELIFAAEKQSIRDEYVKFIEENVLNRQLSSPTMDRKDTTPAAATQDNSSTQQQNQSVPSKPPLSPKVEGVIVDTNNNSMNGDEKLPEWLLQVGTKGSIPLDVLQILHKQRIDDAETLLMLSGDDLASLGIPLGPKMKLLKYIKEQQLDSSTSSPIGRNNSTTSGASFSASPPGAPEKDIYDQALDVMMKKISSKFHRTLVIDPADVEIYFDAQLGSGGYASVFEAQTVQGRPLAAKVFDTFEEGMFEATTLSELHHRNIISLVGLTANVRRSKLVSAGASAASQTAKSTSSNSMNLTSTMNGTVTLESAQLQVRFIMLLELAEGSLADLLKNRSNHALLTFDVLLRFVLQIAEGLRYLHGHSPRILHLDLKPNNLLFFNTVVKLCDFGISRETSANSTRTQVTSAKGTNFYVPSELVEFNRVGPTSDTYAFGVILFQLLTLKSSNECLQLVTELNDEKKNSKNNENENNRRRYTLPPTAKEIPGLLCELLDQGNILKHISQEDLQHNFAFLISICKKCLSVDAKDRPRDGQHLYDLLVEGASKTSAASSLLVMGLNQNNNNNNNHSSISTVTSSSSSNSNNNNNQQQQGGATSGTSGSSESDDLVTCASKTEIIDFGGTTF